MARLTVLGIGSILMRDDGVGVRLMEAVRVFRPWPADIEFIDGGAGGLNLLGVIEAAERLVVFDAAEMQLSPGQCRVITPEQVTKESAEHRVSLHDVPFLETLELAGQFFRRPAAVKILAIQPADVSHGRELSPELSSAFGELIQAGAQLVEESYEAA